MMQSSKSGIRWAAPFLCVLIANSVAAQLIPQPPVPLFDFDRGLRDLYRFSVAPDGRKAFFSARTTGSTSHPPIRLYEVGISGGAITPRTTQPDTSNFDVEEWEYSPNGVDLVFRQTNHFAEGDLYALPIGSGLPRQLTFDDTVGEPIVRGWRLEFTHDGSRLIYSADTSPTNERRSLFSVSLDGSSPPVQLNGPLVGISGSVNEDWKLLPGGTELMYGAPQDAPSRIDLFRVNAVGGPAQRVNVSNGLHLTLADTFALNASANRVAYSLEAGPAGRPTVLTRLLPGGSETELSPNLAKHNDVDIRLHGFAQNTVVFEADFDVNHLIELYAAPAGSGPLHKLTDFFNGLKYRTNSALISSGGDYIIFVAEASNDVAEAFRYDVASQAMRSLGKYQPSGFVLNPMVRFSPAGGYFLMGGGGFPTSLFTEAGDLVRAIPGSLPEFHPDGEHFAYTGVLFTPDSFRFGLIMEHVDGAGGPILLSNDHEEHNPVERFTFAPDGTSLLYTRGGFGDASTLYAVRFVPEPEGGMSVAVAALFGWKRRRSKK